MSNRYVGGYVINEKLIPTNQIVYTTPGIYSWVCPENVTSVSVVCIGGGGGAGHFFGTGGGGGALAYKNNISVTPGISYTVQVGGGGAAGQSGLNGANGTSSSFTAGFGTMIAGGGEGGKGNANFTNGGAGGTYSNADGGGNGGTGGPRQTNQGGNSFAAGGGGAGGYSGNGGNAGGASGFSAYQDATAGTGGGGGGGAGWGPATNSNSDITAGGGGGTGLLGQGTSGAAGTLNSTTVRGGGGGSGGNNGATPITFNDSGTGGLYGGGGGSRGGGINILSAGPGASGAVRIIWPGDTRTFPSANTGNLTTATSIIATSSTYASGVYRLSDYQSKVKNGLWPLSERYNFSDLNAISINEGANTTFSVNTTNVLTGTQLYWSILHNTSNSFDFISTGNTFTVTNNVGSFVVQTVADLSTEGTEYFQLQVQKTDANGEVLLTSGAITLADTSTTPPPPVDVFLVGGGGGQQASIQFGGGGGGGGVLTSNNFTGIVLGTTYTVTVGAGSFTSGTQSSVTGNFSVPGSSLIGSGGGFGAWAQQGSGNFAGNVGGSGGSGGGALVIVTTGTSGGVTRVFVNAFTQGSGTTSNGTLISNYPGIFTERVGNGLGAFTSGNGFNINGGSGQTLGFGGGGGGASNEAIGSPIPNTGFQSFINGSNGVLGSFDTNYYGGGGCSRGIQYRLGSQFNYTGTAGLGGGGSANSGGGGNSAGTSAAGGSGVVMFRFETSKISATASGTRTTSTSGIYTIIRFTGSGTISFTRI